ncbi:MAG: dihydrofolate reductase [Candidatus Gracilibacteria bacterium]|nr:dihydrofolate reductase [Candidatus Gracilibacteria bacterium]
MIHIIAAMAGEKRVIGIKNSLPWNFKEDLKHFKELTTGNIIIMGRKTFESIGRPLPNRINVIITRDNLCTKEGCEVYNSLEEAIDGVKKYDKEIFIIGGGEIYRQSLVLADILDLTLIKGDFEGDTYFPEFEDKFKEVNREEFEEFDFITYKKK